MKKIVSIFIALFVFIGMNAQVVTFNSSDFESVVKTSRGKSSFTINKTDVTLSAADNYVFQKLKGLVMSGNFLLAKGSDSDFSLTISLTGDASGKIIRKIRILTGGVNPILGSVVNGGTGSGLSTNRENLYFDIYNDFTNISEISLTKCLASDLYISSIEVYYGELMENVELKDDEAYPYYDRYIYAKNVTYTRSMNGNHWGTLCLPFDYVLNDNRFAAYQTRDMGSVVTSGMATVSKLLEGVTIFAGTPVIFCCNNPELVVKVEKVLLSTDAFQPDGISFVDRLSDDGTGYQICGNIVPLRLDHEYVYFVSSDKLKYCPGNAYVNLKPYRAYIAPLYNNTSNSRTRAFSFNVLDEDDNVIDNFSFADNDDVTAVESAETDTEENIIGIFTADGKKVNEYQKGINIVKTTNGVKKVYMR